MSRPPSLAMNTVPFEFIKNTRKQLLSVSYFLESRTFQETSRDEFSVLLSEWGETEHVEYLEVTFYFSPTDNLLWWRQDNQVNKLFANPQASNYHIYKLWACMTPTTNENVFRPLSEEHLLLIQKAMLKTEAPVVVCSYSDKNLSQEAPSMFFYTSIIKKLVNFLPRIRHFGCNQNDPFVHEVLFRSIDMGSLRSVHLRRCKLSKDIEPKITDWMRGREFKEFRMTAHDEDQSLFDRLINAINEIANELEQKHTKYQLYLHYDVLKSYPDFRNFAFMESFGLTGDFNLLHVCFQRL